MENGKLTMTILDVYHAMRDAGIRSSPQAISAGIASGAYPFGKVIGVGETGRRTVRIYKVDFMDWLESKKLPSKSALVVIPRTG